MTWEVAVTLGDYSWTITEPADPGEVPDELVVLDDLRFGWSMPKGGLWPLQPEAQQAELTLSVPDFPEVDTIGEGDLLAITVRADAAGPIVARFYGDVTDLEAGPRAGRPGVLLSVVAVDLTVRTLELNPSTSVILFTEAPEDQVIVDNVWVYKLGGVGIGAAPALWSLPPRSMGITQDINTTKSNIRAQVDQVLLQAHELGGPTAARHRLILSPFVNPATGTMAPAPSGRSWTLDKVFADTQYDRAPFVCPAGAVDMGSLRWAIAKGDNAGHVNVAGWNGDAANVATYDVPGAFSDVYQGVASSFKDGSAPAGTWAADDAASLAQFYGQAWARWQVKTLRVLASRTGLDIPADLFPDWTAPETDPARSACYSRYVIVTDTTTSVTPTGANVEGVLTAAAVHIVGGRLELELSLRTPQVLRPPQSDLGIPGYGLGAFGWLVPQP